MKILNSLLVAALFLSITSAAEGAIKKKGKVNKKTVIEQEQFDDVYLAKKKIKKVAK